jgi:hypothetical protein
VPDLDRAARDELRPRSDELSRLLSNDGLKSDPQKLIDSWSDISSSTNLITLLIGVTALLNHRL